MPKYSYPLLQAESEVIGPDWARFHDDRPCEMTSLGSSLVGLDLDDSLDPGSLAAEADVLQQLGLLLNRLEKKSNQGRPFYPREGLMQSLHWTWG